MQLTKSRVLSAMTAGSLTLAVVAAITVGSGSGHTPQPAALAAQTESFPPVNIDDCPILHTGYPTGECVAQLQTDLNIIQGNHLAVDGTFGLAGSQTYKAVIAFQQAQGLPQDGLVGPDTKKALDAALSSDSAPTPTVSPAADPTPTPSQASPARASGALEDDPHLLPYPFDIPDLGNCPPLIPQVFEYSNGVLAAQGCVAALQQSLDAVGFGVPVTGDYEPTTYAAVWNFQLAHSGDYGLVATGRADSSTISALDKIANSPAALSSVNNGADMNGNGLVEPPLPAPIGRVQLLENTQPTVEDPPDDCATTCDDPSEGE